MPGGGRDENGGEAGAAAFGGDKGPWRKSALTILMASGRKDSSSSSSLSQVPVG